MPPYWMISELTYSRMILNLNAPTHLLMSDKIPLKLLFEFIVRIFDIPQIQNFNAEILCGIDHKVLAMKRLTEPMPDRDQS